ncbi:hypothetical protein LCGC14_2817410, partial [marine sediment metagenome]
MRYFLVAFVLGGFLLLAQASHCGPGLASE